MKRAVAVVLLLLLAACDRAPPQSEMDRLRTEAQTANSARAAEAREEESKRTAESLEGWSLAVYGPSGAVGRLSGKELDVLATTEFATVAPSHPPYPLTPVRFRGVAIRAVLERFFAGKAWPDGEEITFVAKDGFRSTVLLKDALAHPIALALAQGGHPIPLAEGGPLYLVFPHADVPELKEKYPDRYWEFYVTDMIAGTEPLRIHVVGGRTLDAAALRALPKKTMVGPVEYHAHWPGGDVRLTGVLLRDVLAAAGVAVPAGGGVVVRGKASVHRNPADPRRITAEHVLHHDVLLAMAWGDDDAPISAKLGGPMTLALPKSCDAAYGQKFWMPFIEELEVVP